VPDAIFAHPRLAAVYDAFDGPRDDLAAYVGIAAELGAGRVRVLRAIRAALRPGGYLVFETRRPERRAWEEWAADPGPVTLDVPGAGPVVRRLQVTVVSVPYVSFCYTYLFQADGAVITSGSTSDRPGREFVFSARFIDRTFGKE
jgi:hypothetical protein